MRYVPAGFSVKTEAVLLLDDYDDLPTLEAEANEEELPEGSIMMGDSVSQSGNVPPKTRSATSCNSIKYPAVQFIREALKQAFGPRSGVSHVLVMGVNEVSFTSSNPLENFTKLLLSDNRCMNLVGFTEQEITMFYKQLNEEVKLEEEDKEEIRWWYNGKGAQPVPGHSDASRHPLRLQVIMCVRGRTATCSSNPAR